MTAKDTTSGANKSQLPRWRVRGTGPSGEAFELRIHAAEIAAAVRKASKPFVTIESCVLIESSGAHCTFCGSPRCDCDETAVF